MKGFRLGVVVTVALLVPNMGNAQAFQLRTPPPEVSAAAAFWQINSEPIMVGGLMYYPTRGFRLFDGQIMVQTGLFQGVPVYSDTTLEPFSELYVPLSGGRMRVYERRREGELAGTMGSHLPTFPVESPSVPARAEIVVGQGAVGTSGSAVGTSGSAVGTSGSAVGTSRSVVGTSGSDVSRVASDSASAVLGVRSRPRRTVMTPVQNGVANGIWLEFNGGRWYSSGAAESFSPERFEPIGEYRGFPVYRDKTTNTTDIWVSVVKDGPLAPYRKQ
jgi:hypothetical protein